MAQNNGFIIEIRSYSAVGAGEAVCAGYCRCVLSLKSSQVSWTSSWEEKLVPFDTGLREAKGGALAGAGDAAGLGATLANKVSQ